MVRVEFREIRLSWIHKVRWRVVYTKPLPKSGCFPKLIVDMDKALMMRQKVERTR